MLGCYGALDLGLGPLKTTCNSKPPGKPLWRTNPCVNLFKGKGIANPTLVPGDCLVIFSRLWEAGYLYTTAASLPAIQCYVAGVTAQTH